MKRKRKKIPLAVIAETALKEAVYEAIKDHERTGDPVVIYRNGKVVEIQASKLRIKKPRK